MTVESSDDQAVFLADFGRVVTYTKTGGSPVTLQGLYDVPASTGPAFNEAPGFILAHPQIVVRTIDVPTDAGEGDAVAVAGVATRYQVRALIADGTGMTRIELESTS